MATKWTVMVYLGADNDLSVDFLWDLKEMQESDVGSQVAVVAQYDPGQGIPTQRYVINRESLEARVKARKNNDPDSEDGWLILDDDEIRPTPEEAQYLQEIVNDYRENKTDSEEQELRFERYANSLQNQTHSPNKNTGDPMTLLQFIFWGISRHAAEHYMVVLTGHGSGAVEDFLLKDETARDSLTLHELRDVFQLVRIALSRITDSRLSKALGESEERKRRDLEQELEQLRAKGRPLDILGLDSCLMSMAEVYYQLLGSVDYLVGAEGFEPSGGWPYQRVLKSLPQQTNPEEAAKKIVDDYVLYYFDYALAGLSVDLSACKIEEENLEGSSLAKKIGDLASKLTARLESRAGLSMVMSARQQAQPYKFDQYVDLVDFCNQLKLDPRCSDDDGLTTCCGAVQKHIDKIVKNSSYVGPDYQKSNGLSVYFPWHSVPEQFSKGYEQLQFTRHTNGQWGRFVQKFTETMRALHLAAPVDTTLPAGKTLYSARTLWSGRIGLYSGRTGLGSAEPLYLAYGRVPSVVWKPKKNAWPKTKDVIDAHVERLQAPKQLGTVATGSERTRKVLRETLGIIDK